MIDSLYVYHLAVCESERLQLNPLDEVLTDSNSQVFELLKKNEVEIKKIEEQLSLFFKGKKLNPAYIENRSPLLAKRMGQYSIKDYCINGFSFFVDIESTSDGYFEYLEKGPEFIQLLDELLGTTIAQLFRKRNHYYCLVFDVPFLAVIIDSDPSLSVSEKKKLFVRNALKTLLGAYQGYPYSGCNSILRLPDDYHVHISSKILIRK